MEDWRRDDALNIDRGGHVDFSDVLPGTNNDNGSPEAMNVYHHQPTARLPRPMYLPHPSSSHGSFRYPSVIEPVPRYSTNAVPSLDLSGPTLSASTTDAGISKIPPPSNDESETYPSIPFDGWRLPANQKGRVSPLVLQEMEQQPLGKAAICRGSPTASPRDRDLTHQRRPPELTEPARSQTSLLPIRDASLIHGNLLRRQTLRLRKTCDACGKHKKACDGKRPCYRCVRRRTECIFGLRKRTGPKRPKDSKESGELVDAKAKAYMDGRNGSGGVIPTMPPMEMLARGASSSSASEDVVLDAAAASRAGAGVASRAGAAGGSGGTTFVPSVEDNHLASSSQNLGNSKRSNPRGFRSNDSNPSADDRAAWPSATVFPPTILSNNSTNSTKYPNSGERDAVSGGAADRDSSEQHDDSPEISTSTSTSDVRPIYGSGGGGGGSGSNSRDTNSSMNGSGGSLPRLLDGEAELWTAATYCTKPLPRPTHTPVEITPSSSSCSSSSSSSRWAHPMITTSSWEPWHGCGPLHESNLSPTLPPGGRSSAHSSMEEWHQYQYQHQHQVFPLPAGVEAERARARARGISRHSLESSPTLVPAVAVATAAAPAAPAAPAAGDNEEGQEEEEQAMLEHRFSRWSPTRHQRIGELGEMRVNGGVGSSEQQGYGFLRFPS